MKDGTGRDRSSEAWRRDQIGVWYGAFSADDFLGNKDRLSRESQLEILNALPAQRKLNWNVRGTYLQTVRRLTEISQTDWVLLYLPDEKAIGMARTMGPLCSAPTHPMNVEGEVFKYRKIHSKKVFEISELPDVYRILQSQGQGNVFVLRETWDLAQSLAREMNAKELKKRLLALPFNEMLDFLGPSGWESFSFAYLVQECEFVPTGLSIGRTLPTVDIVGRRRSDGCRIIAQCKKNNSRVEIDEEFLGAYRDKDLAFYFAYGGCKGKIPPGVKVIDSDFAVHWSDSPNGKRFRELLLME